MLAAGLTRPKRHPQARVAAHIQRATLSAVMTLVVAMVDRRLRKALDRKRPA
jgi:hypothetical protein